MTDTTAESKNLTLPTPTTPETTLEDRLNGGIEQSRNFLLARQNEKGFWVDELESNATITAELIFFMHFTGTVDLDRQAKIANYLFDKQRDDGSLDPSSLRQSNGTRRRSPLERFLLPDR